MLLGDHLTTWPRIPCLWLINQARRPHIPPPGFNISQAQPYYCSNLHGPSLFALQQAQARPNVHPAGQPIVQSENTGTTALSGQATTDDV
ncbi:hypothetical protein Tco_1247248 [Tanacetum coccineum]